IRFCSLLLEQLLDSAEKVGLGVIGDSENGQASKGRMLLNAVEKRTSIPVAHLTVDERQVKSAVIGGDGVAKIIGILDAVARFSQSLDDALRSKNIVFHDEYSGGVEVRKYV